LHKYTFQIREIKQISIPHIRTLARSHRHTLCAQISMLHQCTAYRGGVSGATTTRCHSSAVQITDHLSKSQIICPNLPRGEAYTQTDYNHGCCFTDKRSILPWLRGVFTSDFNVWKHHRKLGVVFRTNIICVMCVTKQGRKKMRMWFPMLTGARPITCH